MMVRIHSPAPFPRSSADIEQGVSTAKVAGSNPVEGANFLGNRMNKFYSWVRNGQKVWPTCNGCGCRLRVEPGLRGPSVALYHFMAPDTYADAKGHTHCPYIDFFHAVDPKWLAHIIGA